MLACRAFLVMLQFFLKRTTPRFNCKGRGHPCPAYSCFTYAPAKDGHAPYPGKTYALPFLTDCRREPDGS